MIGSTSRGGGFRGVLDYVFGPGKHDVPDRARLLVGSMMGMNPRELAAEFGLVRQLRPDCKKPVKHISFSLPPGEHLADSQWLEIGRRKAAQEGWDTWCMVEHTDEPHEHFHMIASRITQGGQVIRETGFDIAKTEQLCRQVELDFGLRQVASPERSAAGKKIPDRIKKPTRSEKKRDERTGVMSDKQQLQAILAKAAAKAKTPDELEMLLEDAHVDVRWNRKGGQIQGVSFGLRNYAAKGSKLGEDFKWAALSARLEANQKGEKDARRKSRPRKAYPSVEREGLRASAVALVKGWSRPGSSLGVAETLQRVDRSVPEMGHWWGPPEGNGSIGGLGAVLAPWPASGDLETGGSDLGPATAAQGAGGGTQELHPGWGSEAPPRPILGRPDAAGPDRGGRSGYLAGLAGGRPGGDGSLGLDWAGRQIIPGGGAPGRADGGKSGQGLGSLGQPEWGPVRNPHPLMAEAEKAYAEAKTEAAGVIQELSQAREGGLDDWLSPILPRDPVVLPSPPGYPEPPPVLRMAWSLQALWDGVQALAQVAQEALQRLGGVRKREMPPPALLKGLEAPPRPMESPSKPKLPVKAERKGIDF
jgi:hypothetical protein